jgi:hypothetical protein
LNQDNFFIDLNKICSTEITQMPYTICLKVNIYRRESAGFVSKYIKAQPDVNKMQSDKPDATTK